MTPSIDVVVDTNARNGRNAIVGTCTTEKSFRLVAMPHTTPPLRRHTSQGH